MSRDRESRRRIAALEARLEAVIKNIAEGQKAYEKRSELMVSAIAWPAVFAESDQTRREIADIEVKAQAFKRDLALAQEQASHESAAAASFAAVVGEWASRIAARAMEFEGRLRNPSFEWKDAP